MNQLTKAACLISTAMLLSACGGSQPDATGAGAGAQADQRARAPEHLDDVARLTAGFAFVAGLNTDGTVVAWGDNTYGQLGSGNYGATLVPVPVAGMSGVKALSAGGYHVAALTTDGQVWTWGDNHYAQLGTGAFNAGASLARPVAGMSGVMAIAAGYAYTLALKTDGNVWGWGHTTTKTSALPSVVQGLSGVRAVAAGNDFALAVKGDGSVWAWGSNLFGQLGNGSAAILSSVSPVQVAQLGDVKMVSAGYLHALALKRDGSIWTWGSNAFGQMGIDDAFAPTPVRVQGLPAALPGVNEVKAIVAGTYNSAVVYGDGSVWAWGSNLTGQLGNGTLDAARTPVRIGSISNTVAVAVGTGFIVSLDAHGAVLASGLNSSGQLGNGTLLSTRVPHPVFGLSGVGMLSLGKSTAR